MSTKPFDGDSEGTRAAFREYDDRNPVGGRSTWQIWRDACAYALAASNPAAEAATCKLCQSTGPDVPCAYPTEINRQQAQRIAELEAMLAGCPTADETLKPVAHVPIHPRTGPLWANTVPDLDSGDRPKHYPTRALYFAEDATEASRSADDESAKSGVDTTAIMERIPTVARLYYTGLTTRRYRRASVHTGPGEPLVYRSDVERELRHIDWELRNPTDPAPVASKEAVTLNDEEIVDAWLHTPRGMSSHKYHGVLVFARAILAQHDGRKVTSPLGNLSVEGRAGLFDHMLAVAQANGFESITAAIAMAAKVPKSFDVVDKQISYVAELARRDGAANDKTGQFDIAFERLRTMVRAALAQRDASKAEGQ